jgi:hypothetical protein
MNHPRMDHEDVSSRDLADWLDDVIDQLRWQRRNGTWTETSKQRMREVERVAEDAADAFRGN